MSDNYSLIEHILDDLNKHTFISQYGILKYEHTALKFQLKLRIEFTNQYVLFTNEYVGGEIRKYAFQWQTADNTWLMRWDNVPHFPKLTSFPHHKHDYRSGSEVVTESFNISLMDVLVYIHSQFLNTNQ
ncbi:DUF6516 family protein [Spirosoma harenae]